MPETIHHLHLVSDATGETIASVARACLVQFDSVEPVEHVWSLIRTVGQVDRILSSVESNPGPVLFTLVNEGLRRRLLDGCERLEVPTIAVLDPVIHLLAGEFRSAIKGRPGLQHVMDEDYRKRIDAVHFSLAHDDGQATEELNFADVVVIGVSRTSKTPTCMYLANRGIKAGNVPLVPGVPLPPAVMAQSGRSGRPLVVGLTTDPKVLVDIRRTRLRHLGQGLDETDYVDPSTVDDELKQARRLFVRHGWPVIDVTRRSVEETAASIMTYLKQSDQGTVP
ncbi:MAG: pyruvate, water dikinase regulatory protein [Rhodospirillales bacterium]